MNRPIGKPLLLIMGIIVLMVVSYRFGVNLTLAKIPVRYDCNITYADMKTDYPMTPSECNDLIHFTQAVLEKDRSVHQAQYRPALPPPSATTCNFVGGQMYCNTY